MAQRDPPIFLVFTIVPFDELVALRLPDECPDEAAQEIIELRVKVRASLEDRTPCPRGSHAPRSSSGARRRDPTPAGRTERVAPKRAAGSPTAPSFAPRWRHRIHRRHAR